MGALRDFVADVLYRRASRVASPGGVPMEPTVVHT